MQLSEETVKKLAVLLPQMFNVLFNFTLPESIKEQNILKLDIFNQKVVKLMAEVGNEMGVDTTINLTRRISSMFEKVETPEPIDPFVKISRDMFNGVPVIIHTPIFILTNKLPALVFFHGGGFVYRSPETYYKQAVHLSKQLGAVVVSVNYRYSPENHFPAQLDDCLKAVYFLFENAERYAINPNRIGVIGDSAGGSMAASVSLAMRDKMWQHVPKVQVLIYPSVQMLDFKLASFIQNDIIPTLTTNEVIFFILSYTGLNTSFAPVILNNRHICKDIKTQIYSSYITYETISKTYPKRNHTEDLDCDSNVAEKVRKIMFNPYIFPLMSNSLYNLPPALIITGEFDVLRDDGLIYAARLKQAQVPVEEALIQGGFHDMFGKINRMKIGDEIMNIIVNYLKRKL